MRMSTMIFFFKKNTSYEMRISDWSSDVCSSVLLTEMQRLINHPDANALGLSIQVRPYDSAHPFVAMICPDGGAHYFGHGATAITSLAFMLVCVPEPVCQTTSGNWLSCFPSATSPAAVTMALAVTSSRPDR